MPKRIKKPPAVSHWDSEVRLLLWLATCASVVSFLYYFQRGEVMLYGDAVAHINIARRVFDSKTPGLLQLGTVWLPLPHLLMVPFLVSKHMWQLGVGGSLPSLAAYVFGVVGMFRLVRGALSQGGKQDLRAHVAAWMAALIYAASPNLLYMQTTAMGESLYLAIFVWAVVYFSEFWRGDVRALNRCGLCLAAACWTRYDGWFLTAAMAGTVVWSLLRDRSALPRAALMRFAVVAAAAPALWLAYNGIVYRNPLEFENGPYSAKAIEHRTQSAGNVGHPGTDNLVTAGLYFLKSSEENVAANKWMQRAWILLVLAGLAGAAFVACRGEGFSEEPASPRRFFPFLFLLTPVPFYALSVAYGGVPIFVPPWWPFTMYNVRYGLQLLPAFAAGLALIVWLALRSERWNWRLRLACVLAVLLFVGASYSSIWQAGPVCLREAQVNMRTRNQLETQVAGWLEKLPENATLLMYLGDHVGAVQRAGIPLNDVINEGNHRVWMQPRDPDGLWEQALADAPRYADYVMAFDGDPVWKAVQSDHLKELVQIHVSGQPWAILYRAR